MKCGSRSLCSTSLVLRLGTSIPFLHTSYSPPDRQLLCASYNSLLESFGARCSDCCLGPIPELRSSRGTKRKLLASSRNRIQILETDDPVSSHACVNSENEGSSLAEKWESLVAVNKV